MSVLLTHDCLVKRVMTVLLEVPWCGRGAGSRPGWRVWGLGSWVQGLGFGVWGSGFQSGVYGLWCMGYGLKNLDGGGCGRQEGLRGRLVLLVHRRVRLVEGVEVRS